MKEDVFFLFFKFNSSVYGNVAQVFIFKLCTLCVFETGYGPNCNSIEFGFFLFLLSGRLFISSLQKTCICYGKLKFP